ncbi:MAG: hypothetical protein ABI466_08630 [Chloroflexota bacterium]
MIDLVAANAKDRVVWETITEMSDWFAAPWTLIGARMVQLHAMAAGRSVPRLSLDADALADVRALPGATEELSATLIERGFELGETSTFGLSHRFVRGGVSVDVLGPDGLNRVGSRRTVGKLHTVEVPGGTQALRRTQVQEVRIGKRRGRIPVPDLLGAILLRLAQSRSMTCPKTNGSISQSFLSLVGDVGLIRKDLRTTEKSWLRRRAEMGDPATGCWAYLSSDDAQRGVATFRQLTG